MTTPRERRAETVHCGALYATKRVEFTRLILSLGPAELRQRIPATPEWRVRDAFAHVAGITADLNAGNFGTGDDPDAWTAAQVERRRSRGLGEIADEWTRESETFEAGLRALGYELGSHYVGDLHAHLQDVRSALGLDADRDERTVMVSLDFYLGSLDAALRDAGTGSLEIITGDEHHHLGSGDPTATVAAAPFEVLRVVSGRRSLRQVRSLDWKGDVDAFAPVLSRYPMPDVDLTD